MTAGTTTTRVLPCGESALLVECGGLGGAVGFAARLRETASPVVVDVVPAARTVLVACRAAAELPELRRCVDRVLTDGTESHDDVSVTPPTAGRTVTLDVVYDGPDLADLAESVGLAPDELVRRHGAVTWLAAFGGFAPGFCYLVDERELGGPAHSDGPPPLPTIPRLATPRTRVPAGSVALADRWCGVYPDASPGGWRLIGRTDAVLWDAGRGSPALLDPGDRVRFRVVGGG